ncbi:hypothetical protein, partial [uncultured Mailhella sp.]|uniref:hypothetical protein n=1 Tax=uncultured Mailhella sp. TaxID=1981031 RepID=UPI0025D7C4DE
IFHDDADNAEAVFFHVFSPVEMPFSGRRSDDRALEKDVPGGREPFRNGVSCQGADTADCRRGKRLFGLKSDFSCLTMQKAYDASN